MDRSMEGIEKSRLKWFGLALGFTWVAAMLLPVRLWGCLAGATLITGLIMLTCAGLNMAGCPMKGFADPKDVASGAFGILLGTVLIYSLR